MRFAKESTSDVPKWLICSDFAWFPSVCSQCTRLGKFEKNQSNVPKMFQISTFAVSWECSCSAPLLGKFGEILGTLQAHPRKTAKRGTFEMCLQCPKNCPKFSQKRYTAGTLPEHCKCTVLEHLWYIALVLSKFSEPGTL